MSDMSLQIIIGRNISRYRIAAGMTQAQLAEKVNISVAFISRVERGNKMMKVQTLYAIAQALGVSCDALLSSESPSTHLNNIWHFLERLPSEYYEGVEKLLRVCIEFFEPKDM